MPKTSIPPNFTLERLTSLIDMQDAAHTVMISGIAIKC